MAKDLYALTEDDVKLLKGLALQAANTVWGRAILDTGSYVSQSPEVYIAKIRNCRGRIRKSEGGVPGSAVCNLYKLTRFEDGNTAREYAPILRGDGKQARKKVFNIYPQDFEDSGYFVIRRDKFGAWLCERPSVIPSGDVGGSCSGSSESLSLSSDSESTPCPDTFGFRPQSDFPEVSPFDIKYLVGYTEEGCIARALTHPCPADGSEAGLDD